MSLFFFNLLFAKILLAQTDSSLCTFYVQHHFVQHSDLNKALAYDIDSALTHYKDEKRSEASLDKGKKKTKKKNRVRACSSRRFVPENPQGLKGKWNQAGSSVLYMITWLPPQKPTQRRLQFELFVHDRPTPRRIWVEGPKDIDIPEVSPEAKKEWIDAVVQSIVSRTHS